jgi:hypothetical protein
MKQMVEIPMVHVVAAALHLLIIETQTFPTRDQPLDKTSDKTSDKTLDKTLDRYLAVLAIRNLLLETTLRNNRGDRNNSVVGMEVDKVDLTETTTTSSIAQQVAVLLLISIQ